MHEARAKCGSEAIELGPPVRKEGCRKYEKGWLRLSLPFDKKEEGNDLNGFPESHVIGETGPHSKPRQEI
jgi:hypothetical protein